MNHVFKSLGGEANGSLPQVTPKDSLFPSLYFWKTTHFFPIVYSTQVYWETNSGLDPGNTKTNKTVLVQEFTVSRKTRHINRGLWFGEINLILEQWFPKCDHLTSISTPWEVVRNANLWSPHPNVSFPFPFNLKGSQPWIFIGRTDAETEAPILWPPDAKSWFIRKDPDAWKDWRQEEKGMTEDEMVGWHRRLNGHEFEKILGGGEGQESLACCCPWGHKELDTTEWLNTTTTQTHWIRKPRLAWQTPGVNQIISRASATFGSLLSPFQARF